MINFIHHLKNAPTTLADIDCPSYRWLALPIFGGFLQSEHIPSEPFLQDSDHIVNTRCYTVCALRDWSETALSALMIAAGATLLALALLGTGGALSLAFGIVLLVVGATFTLIFGISALYNTYYAHYHYRHFLNSLPKESAPATREPRALDATTGASSPPPLEPVPKGSIRFMLENTTEGAFVVPMEILLTNCPTMEAILQFSDQTTADARTISCRTLSADSLAALRNVLTGNPLPDHWDQKVFLELLKFADMWDFKRVRAACDTYLSAHLPQLLLTTRPINPSDEGKLLLSEILRTHQIDQEDVYVKDSHSRRERKSPAIAFFSILNWLKTFQLKNSYLDFIQGYCVGQPLDIQHDINERRVTWSMPYEASFTQFYNNYHHGPSPKFLQDLFEMDYPIYLGYEFFAQNLTRLKGIVDFDRLSILRLSPPTSFLEFCKVLTDKSRLKEVSLHIHGQVSPQIVIAEASKLKRLKKLHLQINLDRDNWGLTPLTPEQISRLQLDELRKRAVEISLHLKNTNLSDLTYLKETLRAVLKLEKSCPMKITLDLLQLPGFNYVAHRGLDFTVRNPFQGARRVRPTTTCKQLLEILEQQPQWVAGSDMNTFAQTMTAWYGNVYDLLEP